MISDLGDDGKIELSSDMGSEQTNPFTSDFRLEINYLWQQNKFMRLPLQELPDQVRYKMKQEAPSVYLFPDDKGVVKEKPKGTCPFGYGKTEKE